MNLKAGKDTVMGDHISQLESLMHMLASMGMPIQEPMQVAILLVSLGNLSEYGGTVASIKTLDAELATWSNMTTRIIEEESQLKSNAVGSTTNNERTVFGARHGYGRPSKKDVVCWNCQRKGHYVRDCWLWYSAVTRIAAYRAERLSPGIRDRFLGVQSANHKGKGGWYRQRVESSEAARSRVSAVG